MKFIAKTLLIFISIPLILLSMLSINIKFQFLSPGFWIKSFDEGNVYSQASLMIESRLIERVEAEGGTKSDVKVLSNLISAPSLKTFFERNIDSILLYANGKTPEMMVYVPLTLKDALEGYDYYNLDDSSEKMTFQEFLNRFNVNGIESSDIAYISKLGLWSWVLIFSSFALLIITFVLMYLMTSGQKRLWAPSISLTLAGFIILGLSLAGDYFNRMLVAGIDGSANTGTSLLAVFAPPLMQNVTRIWLWFGISSLVFGIAFLFVKKPPVNNTLNRKK